MTSTRSPSVNNSCATAHAQLVRSVTFPMTPLLTVSPCAFISFAAAAPTKTVDMPMLASALLHPCAVHLRQWATVRKALNALTVTCLNAPTMLTQVTVVMQSAACRTSILLPTSAEPRPQRPREAVQMVQIHPTCPAMRKTIRPLIQKMSTRMTWMMMLSCQVLVLVTMATSLLGNKTLFPLLDSLATTSGAAAIFTFHQAWVGVGRRNIAR